MSEFNIEIEGGSSKRLKTAGKYCDRDIVVTASGGGGGEIDALIDRSITEVTSSAPSISNSVFLNCGKLTTANFPNATSIGENAFYNCTSLTDTSFPNVVSLGGNALRACKSLRTIDLPNATSFTGMNQFQECSELVNINIPKVTTLGSGYTFYSCYKLSILDLPMVTSLPSSVFSSCYVLRALLLRRDSVVTGSASSAFSHCYRFLGTVNSKHNPDGLRDGYIYVPRALIEDYKVATNWSTFPDQFRALEDYTVDGTTTGAFDESKI